MTTSTSPAEVLAGIYKKKLPPTATYPKGVSLEDLYGPVGRDKRDSIPHLMLSAFQAGLPVHLVGAPGVAKTAMARAVAEMADATLVYFGPNSDPSTAVVPAIAKEVLPDGTVVEHVDFILEDALTGDNPKVILFDELSRMPAEMRQTALELFGPIPRIAGHEIQGVIGRVSTGNRTEDGVDALDPALSTRLLTIEVDASVVPWKYHVSKNFQKDLSKAFKAHDELDPFVRKQVTPRKMERLIWNIVHNGTPTPGLAIHESEHEKFVDKQGNDVTVKVLRALCEALDAPYVAELSDPIGSAITAVVEHGATVFVEGPPGVGKTSQIEAELRSRRPDAEVMVISMANAAPEDLALVMVQEGQRLKRQLNRFFASPAEQKFLICDELWRCPPYVRDMMLELFAERTLCGIPTGVTGIIGISNPVMIDGGYQLDVGTPDAAQADRFTMSVVVKAEDMAFAEYLAGKYGLETVEPFLDWWHSLSAVDQTLFNVRTLERAILWHLQGFNKLDLVLPWYAGQPLDLSLHELERRLAGRTVIRIREVMERHDYYVEELQKPGGQDSETHRQVFDAFDRSDLVSLKPHKAKIGELFPLLSQQAKINLLRQSKDRAEFWRSVALSAGKK